MSAAVENTPALAVVVKGEVVSSNLPEFREAVTMFVGAINRDLSTDEQFGQAEIDVKKLKALEDSIKAAKVKALSDAEQLNSLFTALDNASGEVSAARLDLEKQIEKQKKSVRAQLVADALNKIDCAPRLRLKTYGSIIENAIKGKRTLESMEKALAQIVGSLNEQLAASKAEILEWEEENSETVPDSETLELEPAATVRLKLQARTQARLAAIEKKRLEDEAAQAKAAQAKAEAEARAAQQAPAAPAPAPAPSPSVNAAPPAPPLSTPAPAAEAPDEETEEEELARICALVRAQLVSLKPVLDGAKHANNILRIRAFRAAVNPAFTEMQKGGAQ